MKTHDRWGVALIAPDEALASRFDEAVLELCLMRGQPSHTLGEREASSNQCVLVEVFESYLNLYAQTPEGNQLARDRIASARAAHGSQEERERAHLEAAAHWSNGALDRALSTLRIWIDREPRDLLALRIAQDLAFFLGDQDSLLDIPEGALGAWKDQELERGLVLGMVAFGLEEKGQYRQAEEYARDALTRDPTDPWSTHALTHVMEMEGRSIEGAAFLRSSAPHWSPSFFASHNWWHLALFLIEIDEFDGAVELLHGPISAPGHEAWFEIVNQASLLWRLWLLDVDAGPPAPGLLQVLKKRTNETLSIFNSLHAVAALSLAGDTDAVEEILATYETHDSGGLGLDLLQGFAEFAHAQWSDASLRLSNARSSTRSIGGSTAQRDLIDQTLLLSLCRSGGSRGLINELVTSHPSRWSAVTTGRILGSA